jgi:hypothetical protein
MADANSFSAAWWHEFEQLHEHAIREFKRSIAIEFQVPLHMLMGMGLPPSYARFSSSEPCACDAEFWT